MFSSQEIDSGLVSFYMIFEALQSALFGFNFHSLSSKILKIPEFNLQIIDNHFGKNNSDSPQNAFSQFKCFLSTDKVLSRHIFRSKSKIKP